MSADRPLTDAQERALIALNEYADSVGPCAFLHPPGVHARSLDRLAALGYAETRERPLATVARITDKGRELLAGMGD